MTTPARIELNKHQGVLVMLAFGIPESMIVEKTGLNRDYVRQLSLKGRFRKPEKGGRPPGPRNSESQSPKSNSVTGN